MSAVSRRAAVLGVFAILAACARRPVLTEAPTQTSTETFDPPLYANETPGLRRFINQYADQYEVPRALVHKIVIRESRHRPAARNGPYYGLMQMLPATARGMGFSGPDHALLDAETNLKFGVKYLRGAWLLADGNFTTAERWYSRGYYYEAKRRGMLVETGLRG